MQNQERSHGTKLAPAWHKIRNYEVLHRRKHSPPPLDFSGFPLLAHQRERPGWNLRSGVWDLWQAVTGSHRLWQTENKPAEVEAEKAKFTRICST